MKQLLLPGVCNRRDVLLPITDASPPVTFILPEKQGAGRFNLGAVPPLAAEKGALLLKRSSSDKEKRSKTVMKL